MLLPFTSNEDVRALLGVSELELSDAVLNLPVYELGLRRKLKALYPQQDIIALFLSVEAIAAPARTPAQVRFHEAMYYYASVAAAVQAGISLALVAPKRITDDKSGVERFSDSPYRDVLDRLEKDLLGAKDALLDALEELTGAGLVVRSERAVLFVAAKRNYDPVTGASA